MHGWKNRVLWKFPNIYERPLYIEFHTNQAIGTFLHQFYHQNSILTHIILIPSPSILKRYGCVVILILQNNKESFLDLKVEEIINIIYVLFYEELIKRMTLLYK